MIKYRSYSDVNFKKRKDFPETDKSIQEEVSNLKFMKPFLKLFKNVNLINIKYNVIWNGLRYTSYWIHIGSDDPESLLGIDFIIIRYFIPSGHPMVLGMQLPLYFIQCGPSLQVNTELNDPKWFYNANVYYPISASILRIFSLNSYATERTDFDIFLLYMKERTALKIISQYFPNLLKYPSKYKNKCYCKVNNKYLKKLKKLGLINLNKPKLNS